MDRNQCWDSLVDFFLKKKVIIQAEHYLRNLKFKSLMIEPKKPTLRSRATWYMKGHVLFSEVNENSTKVEIKYSIINYILYPIIFIGLAYLMLFLVILVFLTTPMDNFSYVYLIAIIILVISFTFLIPWESRHYYFINKDKFNEMVIQNLSDI